MATRSGSDRVAEYRRARREARIAGRREDLEVLAAHFLGQARRSGEPAPALSAEALAVLGEYEWPGNVAELKALCEALAAAARPGEPIGGNLVRRVLASLVQ